MAEMFQRSPVVWSAIFSQENALAPWCNDRNNIVTSLRLGWNTGLRPTAARQTLQPTQPNNTQPRSHLHMHRTWQTYQNLCHMTRKSNSVVGSLMLEGLQIDGASDRQRPVAPWKLHRHTLLHPLPVITHALQSNGNLLSSLIPRNFHCLPRSILPWSLWTGKWYWTSSDCGLLCSLLYYFNFDLTNVFHIRNEPFSFWIFSLYWP